MSPRVLLIGGHGKVSQHLTPLILARSWHLTSMIRDPAQKPTITALAETSQQSGGGGGGTGGTLDVLVSSIEDVKTQDQAQSIIEATRPDYIVWSAGAGGRGGPERTFAIDRDACIAFARAAAAAESTSRGVSKFLVISYIGSRRGKAPWWTEEDWKATQAVNEGALKNYHIAKLAADEALTALGEKRAVAAAAGAGAGGTGGGGGGGGGGKNFAAISLRPGTLSDEKEEGKIALGKIGARGKVRRSDVARVTMELLANDVGSCWLDLLEGSDGIQEAVQKAISQGVNCVEGEDIEAMIKEYA